jgi:hypothetical protein
MPEQAGGTLDAEVHAERAESAPQMVNRIEYLRQRARSVSPLDKHINRRGRIPKGRDTHMRS